VIGQEIISIMRGEKVRIPKKSIARQLGFIIGQEGITKAIEAYYSIKSSDPEVYNVEEPELNQLGIELLFRFNMTEEASRVFEVNMLEFPHSYNTYDSYAFSLKQKGDYVNAIRFYKLGLQILKDYPQLNDGESVRKDAEKAEKSIKEMELKTKD
jgi:tetratricopeptide (TPR) repeat protein